MAVRALQAWRSQVPEIRIDLSHAFLTEANHGPVSGWRQ
jgi:hypothetical protein